MRCCSHLAAYVVGLALVAAVLLPAAGQARDRFSLNLAMRAGAEYDSNVEQVEGGGTADGLTRLGLDVMLGYVPGQGHAVSFSHQVGAKLYYEAADEDTLINQLHGSYRAAIVDGRVGLGLSALVKDRLERVSVRDYFFGLGGCFIDVQVAEGLLMRGQASYVSFAFKSDHSYNNAGGAYDFGLYYAPHPSHTLRVGYRYEHRHYSVGALEEQEDGLIIEAEDGRKRFDQHHGAHLDYRYLGVIFVEIRYSFWANLSSSFGYMLQRHQIRLNLSFEPLWDIIVALRLNVQLTRYLDGLLLDPTRAIDSENRNSATLVLSREVGWGFEVSASYSVYFQEISTADTQYVRHLGGLSVAYRFEL